MKLHLDSPHSERIIEAMKKVLNYTDEQIHEDCYCGKYVSEFVTDSLPFEFWQEDFKDLKLLRQTLKDIALHAFGNDVPSTVHYMETLRFIGDGICPDCGSNDVEDIAYDGRKCKQCGAKIQNP